MDPYELGKLIIMLGGMAGLYLKINQAARAAVGKGEAREITNDPLNVREVPEYMSRRECTIHHHNFETRLSSLELRFDRHITDIKTTTDSLRDDITELRDRMEDRFVTMSDELREISRAVGRLEGS